MIAYDDILNMNFYKKEKFTGSYQGMRYLIKKAASDTAADADTNTPAPMTDVFCVTVWPGPYNYETTPEEKKLVKAFPFTLEGKKQVVDWMNAQWKELYEKKL